jgi:N-acyl-D-aspartate/D-glutamate deacylase
MSGGRKIVGQKQLTILKLEESILRPDSRHQEAAMKKKTSVVTFIILAFLPIFFLAGCFQAAQDNSFDLIIKGGRIYDGTAAKPRIADIGIKGDKIAAIGTFSGQATKTIDAKGLIVTPGFIDVHSHTDLFLKEKGIRRVVAYIKPAINGNHNYLYQGVTTIITGNCSRGYTNTAKWLGWVDSLRFGTNVYHLAPAGAIREELFGQTKTLDERQRNLWKKRLLKEMDNGAIGLSFDLAANPDQLLTREELADIARSSKPYGAVISLHLRNSSGEPDSTGNPALLSSLQEAVEISRISQTPVEISNLELTAPWNNLSYGQINKIISEARQEGIDITADQTPYDADFDALTRFLPDQYLSSYEIKKDYTNPEGKKNIIKAIDKIFTSLGPEKFLIVSYPANKAYNGKTIRQIATLEGRTPAECYWEMVTASPAPMVVVSDSSDHFAKKIMSSPLVFTASEGITYLRGSALPHPAYWGAFPRKLRKYAIEDKIVPLNDAIRSMTALPAEKFKLRGRGQIAVGNFADIAVLNLTKIREKSTFLQPEQYAEGVQYLVVNGILSIENGRITGKKGGKALKRI